MCMTCWNKGICCYYNLHHYEAEIQYRYFIDMVEESGSNIVKIKKKLTKSSWFTLVPSFNNRTTDSSSPINEWVSRGGRTFN